MPYDKIVKNIIDNSMYGRIAGKVFRIKAHVRAAELVEEIEKAIIDKNGLPVVEWILSDSGRDKDGHAYLVNRGSARQFELAARHFDRTLPLFDGFITILSDDDPFNGQNNNQKQAQAYKAAVAPVVTKHIHDRAPWVLIYFPNSSQAAAAKMSLSQYRDFWNRVCSLDYSKMDKAMDPLKKLMEKTDAVRILGRGTDLTFSIKGQKAVKCSAQCNMPDGEVMTAPIKNSINGVVQYNTELEHNCIPYKNIRLEFKDGKVVRGESEINNDKFQKLLDADAGSRFAGEFSLGVNPVITKCTGEILYDEKINGSFHIALGNCYRECPNGNKSHTHFDMIQIQTPKFGGGEIWFDGVLIRKNGKFVLKELSKLNG
ncbi:MAG: aminopeptidase [Rickettsiales bacterium]|nr:aminopeptidase [Rickettsiales bacterium]